VTRVREPISFWFLLLFAVCCAAQESGGHQSYFGAIFTVEGNDIKDGCTRTDVTGTKPLSKFVPGCLESLFHGNKGLYGSFENLPPGNSFALGAAFKDSELNTKNWRMNYQIDGQGSFNGSWSSGGFLTMKRSPSFKKDKKVGPAPPSVVVHGPIPKNLPKLGENESSLILNLYAFHTSLNQIAYYGLGENTSVANRALFAVRETITGITADKLLKYGFHMVGEMNGRWPDIEPDHGQSSPSIEQLYTEATAPGLTRQPGFLQFGEGVQYEGHAGGLGKDAAFGVNVDVDYGLNFQQFIAPNGTDMSFRRLTVDFTNDLHLLKRFKPKYGSPTSEQFGTLELRGWMAESIAPAGNVVPFYFQPTLGGGDIDKERTLSSFADYRFRAPDALLFRAQYEKPLPKYSFLGVVVRADSGKVADSRDGLDISHMRHSFGAGLSLRAGNFPYVFLMYSWAGGEGSRTFADVNLSAISSTGGVASLW
jgi:hypothetical protein